MPLNRREFLQSSGGALAAVALGQTAAGRPGRFGAREGRTGRAKRIKYNNPGLRSHLGVGLWAWPLPMDFNGDGLMDLVVVGPGVPSNGAYFFENTGEFDLETKLPIMKPGVRIGGAVDSPQVSYVAGEPIVTTPNAVYPDFRNSGFAHPRPIPAPPANVIHHEPDPARNRTDLGGIRSSQWKYVDFFGSGKLDLIVALEYWGEYNWMGVNQGPGQPAYDSQGRWKWGPIHGYVYLLRNQGTNEDPIYAAPEKIMAGDGPIDVYGAPSPCIADFRGVGKLDIICGEFLDGFTYFENIGTRTAPRYAPGRKLATGGVPIKMDLCIITPTVCDFNGDGKPDLVVGDEDGRVALIENTGIVEDGMPQFLQPRYFQQIADEVKFGAICSPSACDLNGDGIEDLVIANDAGYFAFFQNLGGSPPRWAAPVYLSAGGKLIRIQAGYNGDCQGPSEAKWGYVDVCAADWDGDGLIDLVCSDVWGKVYWFRNVGTKTRARFAEARMIEVEWPGPPPKPSHNWWNPAPKELVIEWRCMPCVIDWNGDGLPDLITVDHEGYLALFERKRLPDGRWVLLPGQRVFWGEGISSWDGHGQPLNHESGLLRMNGNPGGSSGRRTFCFTDWDGDGILDLLVNSVSINFLKGMGRNKDGFWVFKDMGPVTDQRLAGHSTSPTIVHWPDAPEGALLFGTEDGFLYHLHKPGQRRA